MSYSSETSPQTGRAETEFRAAFARLRANTPRILPKAAKLSQNNVAKEAGKDPSALKKSRYPDLIREIQACVKNGRQAGPPSPRQALMSTRSRNRNLKARIAELKAQRDLALRELLSAKYEILNQWQTIQRLTAGTNTNVAEFKPCQKQ